METIPEEDEVSLLDLLLVVAQNLRLLILGPILVGSLALGVGYVLPQSFTSAAILALPTTTTTTPAQAATMMVSPIVLDPVIESLQLSGDETLEVARVKLAKDIKASVGKDTLLRLKVRANSPVQAQAIANAVITNWLKTTLPGAQDRTDLETRLLYAKSALASVTSLLDRLSKEGTAALGKPLTRGEAGASLVAVGELQARYLNDVINIPRALQGLSADVVKQPPTLPTDPSAPEKGLVALLAALGSGFVLLLWVFMRQAWRNAALDPEGAQKVARLRAAMGFGSGSMSSSS